jgi:shikimate dehydrogenase
LSAIDARTALYAVLGRPIAHSLSPRLHQAAFAAEGRNAAYVACDVGADEFLAAVDGLRALGAAGVNLTSPLKFLPYERDWAKTDEVRRSYAANTLAFRPEGIVAHNTDGLGFANFLERAGVAIAGARVVFLGAGGATYGIAPILKDRGADRIHAVINPSARREIPELELVFDDDGGVRDLLAAATIVVRARSGEEDSAVPLDWIPRSAVAVDLRYHPATPPWLAAVRARGVRAANGLGMLIEQALLSQQFWHGTLPPRTALEEAVAWSDPFLSG